MSGPALQEQTAADAGTANGKDQAPDGSGELSPGDIIRGSVVLKIAEESRDIRVKYDPIGADPFYWSVPQS